MRHSASGPPPRLVRPPTLKRAAHKRLTREQMAPIAGPPFGALQDLESSSPSGQRWASPTAQPPKSPEATCMKGISSQRLPCRAATTNSRLRLERQSPRSEWAEHQGEEAADEHAKRNRHSRSA